MGSAVAEQLPDLPRFVLFRVGQERFALPLAGVREVVVPGILSRIPRAPEALRGVMNLRGRVVTVVDLGLLLGGERVTDKAARLLVLDIGRRDLGLLVSQVQTIGSLGEDKGTKEGAPEAAVAWREADQPFEREHVTPYIYRNPSRFRLRNLRNELDEGDRRWTVDTPADLVRFVASGMDSAPRAAHTRAALEAIGLLPPAVRVG